MLVRNSHELGFSLIELMVTIAIIAIVTTVAFPSYTQFIANARIRTVAESISNGLQVARAEAVKRNAIVRFTLANDTSWIIGCPTVTANCPASIQAKTPKEGASASISLTRTGSNTVSFTSLGTTTSVAGQMSQVDVDNSAISTTLSRDLSIRIGVGGNTRVCDPNISATTDPRRC